MNLITDCKRLCNLLTGSADVADYTEFRAWQCANQQRHGVGNAGALQFDVQAGQIKTSIDIDRVHTHRVTEQAMKETSRELRMGARNAHRHLDRDVACGSMWLRTIAIGSRMMRQQRCHTSLARATGCGARCCLTWLDSRKWRAKTA
jgi:hypothetical protein